MLRLVLTTLILLIVPMTSWAKGPYDDVAKNTVDQLAKNSRFILFSSCSRAEGAAYLIISNGRDKGLLIETRQGDVVSIADVSQDADGVKVDDANGGAYSYERLGLLAEELLTYPFLRFEKANNAQLFSRIPAAKCKDQLPKNP